MSRKPILTLARFGAIETAVKNHFVDLGSLIFGSAILNLLPVAAAIYLSSVFSQYTGVRFLGESGIAGLIVAGGTFVLVGPTMMFPVLVVGTLATELWGPDHRRLHQWETDFARTVFKDTIPWDRIRVTNMVQASG